MSFYYDSISDCPAWIFYQLLQGGDLRLLLVSGRFRAEKAAAAYDCLMTEYVAEFGLPISYKLRLQKQLDAVRHYAKAANGVKSALIHAKIAEVEAEKLAGEGGESVSFSLLAASVAKFMQFRLPENISVREFYSYIKLKNGV